MTGQRVLYQVRAFFIAMVTMAGPIALALSPMPWVAAVACAAVGALAGVMLRSDELLVRLVGMIGAYLFGVRAVANWLAPDLPAIWWQPSMVAASAMMVAYFGLPGVRALRMWWQTRTHSARSGAPGL